MHAADHLLTHFDRRTGTLTGDDARADPCDFAPWYAL